MNQKTSKMLKKISEIHNVNLNQLKDAWYNWDLDMKKKAVIAFRHSIREWNKGLKMLREQMEKDKLKKEKDEAKVRKSKGKKTRAKSSKRVAKKD